MSLDDNMRNTTVCRAKQAKSSCTLAVHYVSKWYRCHQLYPCTDRHASNTFHLGTFKQSLYIKFLCALLLNAWYIHIYQKLKTYVTRSAQRIKMNCKKIIFLKCLRQFLHFFIQFTKTGWDSTAKRNVILNACFYKTYIF